MKEKSALKVAVMQSTLGEGGRASVLLDIIEVLNEKGIVPDIYTFLFKLSKEELAQKYNKNVTIGNVYTLPSFMIRKLQDANFLFFNFLMKFRHKKYDFLIDGSNTTCLLPRKARILSYIHYPRKDRVIRRKKLHYKPGEKRPFKSKIAETADFLISYPFYKFHRIPANHVITANSQFTRDAIKKRYPHYKPPIQVIYPSIDLASLLQASSANKKIQVVSIGSFNSSKRQLDQIKIAEELPDIPFKLIGFAYTDSDYYKECEAYIKKHRVGNVELLPNLDYEWLKQILVQSKFFLHTLINEPFGLATVQGVSAGCLPVVPNSGGQKEIVPYNQLRFNRLEEVSGIIRNMQNEDVTNIVEELKAHIQQYDRIVFKQKFKEALQDFVQE